MRVLIADDSIVFRSQIKVAIDGTNGIIVVGTASNGRIAVEKLDQENIDLLVMDLEMPEMTGLEALRELRRRGHKTKVIMFSSHTKAGAEATLECLSAGAQDFVAKPGGENLTIETAAAAIKASLLPKLLQFAPTSQNPVVVEKTQPPLLKEAKTNTQWPRYPVEKCLPSVIVIGSSTGGPAALEEIFRGLSGRQLRCPILVCQHMPPVFTASLAARLAVLTGIPCAEGQHLELLQKKIYVAPGDFHMSLAIQDGATRIVLDQGPQRNSVRPAVDPLFESAADLYAHRCVGIVLTGMGSDGAVGAVALKNKGGGVVIQDKESSVVFGMPGAIFEAKAFDLITGLGEIRELLISLAST